MVVTVMMAAAEMGATRALAVTAAERAEALAGRMAKVARMEQVTVVGAEGWAMAAAVRETEPQEEEQETVMARTEGPAEGVGAVQEAAVKGNIP